MKLFLTLSLLCLAASTAEAGPFRRNVVRTSTQTCTSGECGTTVSRSQTVARGRSAQDIAEAMASDGLLAHRGNDGAAYEGIGCGSTPEAALASCCKSGLPVSGQGVAFGRGQWWACRRHGN